MTEAGDRWERAQGGRALLLLAVAVLLAMAPWFAAAASGAWLGERHGLGPSGMGWLTGSVQIGFVLGTLVVAALNLADLVPARILFGVSAVLAASANQMSLLADSVPLLMGTRGLTGFFLAGVYPPAMKMAATWFLRSRGLAIGVVVGALTLGKALPFLFLDGSALTLTPSGTALRLTSGLGVAGATLVLAFWKEGPYPFPRRGFALGRMVQVIRHAPTRQAILGYVGHMWELYAMWALIPLFLRDVLGARGTPESLVNGGAGFLGFVVIGAGAVGSVLAGAWADQVGRKRIAVGAMALSGGCALTLGWLVAAPLGLVLTLAVIWGVSVVADSAQFSALVTEVAPSHAVGTALTLQTSLGFLVTAVSIWTTVEVVDRYGWGPAFSLLALGPAMGIAAMLRYR